MMKKTYMKPATEVVELNFSGVLMTSGNVEGTGTDTKMFWDDEADGSVIL